METDTGNGDAGAADGAEDEGAAGDTGDVTPVKGQSMDDVDLSDIENELIGDEGGEGEDDTSDDSKDEEAEDGEDSSDKGDGEADGSEEDSDDDSADDDKSDDKADDKKSTEEDDSEESDLDQEVVVEDIDHFEIKEDKRYGIAPIKVPEEFKDNKNVVKLHDAIVNNALQAVRNVIGVANRNQAITTNKTNAENAKVAEAWRSEIDELVKSGDIPELELLSDGKTIVKGSEAGNLIEEVFDFMDDWNAKNPDHKKINSFELAHEKWAAKKAKEGDADKKKAENKRKSKKGSMVGGSGGKSNSKTDHDDVPVKGTSLDDVRDSLGL